MASLKLQLQQLSMMHTSQIVNDPIAAEAEDMHDFINAMESSALLDSSPTKRARTSLFAYPFIEGSRVCPEQEEIAMLRDKLEKCIRKNEAAKAAAAEAYGEAAGQRRLARMFKLYAEEHKDRQDLGIKRRKKDGSKDKSTLCLNSLWITSIEALFHCIHLMMMT